MEFPTVGENNHSSANTTLCVQNPQLSGKMIYGNPSCSRKITIHQRISTLGIQNTINHSSANANCGCTEFPTVGENDQWRLTFSVRKSLTIGSRQSRVDWRHPAGVDLNLILEYSSIPGVIRLRQSTYFVVTLLTHYIWQSTRVRIWVVRVRASFVCLKVPGPYAGPCAGRIKINLCECTAYLRR